MIIIETLIMITQVQVNKVAWSSWHKKKCAYIRQIFFKNRNGIKTSFAHLFDPSESIKLFRFLNWQHKVLNFHCVKSVHIGIVLVCIFPHSAWMRRYSVSLRIQSECGKIRTRITPNTDEFSHDWLAKARLFVRLMHCLVILKTVKIIPSKSNFPVKNARHTII